MVSESKILEDRKLAHGLLKIDPNFNINNKEDLSEIYTPGVATVCKIIESDRKKSKELTSIGSSIAVITDGTAVLGLGNIGAVAGFPIVEAKALIYKDLAGINAIPIVINQVDDDKLIETIKNISGSFSGIHLEDIKAPKCFYIEDTLKSELDIPVYHDDQHGTAIAVLAALINSAKVVNKDFSSLKIVLLGAGASGIATAKLLLSAGIKDIILVDKSGILVEGDTNINIAQQQIAKITNKEKIKGSLSDAMKNSDVFIGLSEGNLVSKKMIESMEKDSIVFALANPIPEISPDLAKEASATIIATGSSAYPNQINNILVFPGLFKGLLESNAETISDKMMIKVAEKLASLIKNPTKEKVIPGVFEYNIVEEISILIKELVK